jgi:hypothetical protein
MGLWRSKRTPSPSVAQAAVSHAITAGAEASERLASASETHSAAAEQAAHEQRTVIAGLRAMRTQNHLAEMIYDSVRRGRA